MKTILFSILLISLVVPFTLKAQVTDTTVCDILANPQSFDGKIVRVKGVVVAGFEEFAIKASGCDTAVSSIWLAYPEGTKGKAGPAAVLRLQLAANHPGTALNVTRSPVSLEKNKDFKDFDNFLSTPAKANGLCPGCVKFTVNATVVGRLDGTRNAGLVCDAAGKVIGIAGFGNLNQ